MPQATLITQGPLTLSVIRRQYAFWEGRKYVEPQLHVQVHRGRPPERV